MRPSAPLAFAALLALTACTPAKPAEPAAPPAPAAAPAEPPTAGMANPASVACVDSGGKLEIYDTLEGQIGVCTTKDGKVCEEWDLYRDHKCTPPPRDMRPTSEKVD